MFKSQCSHMCQQKSILSHVTTLTFVVTCDYKTTLTFVVTCDYIDFFLANVTVNHNVHTFTIIVHGYLFHSLLINVVNYNEFWGFKTQCTTKSVEMSYYVDPLPNLKSLNLQFRQEIKIFYSKRLVRTWIMALSWYLNYLSRLKYVWQSYVELN